MKSPFAVILTHARLAIGSQEVLGVAGASGPISGLVAVVLAASITNLRERYCIFFFSFFWGDFAKSNITWQISKTGKD